MTLHNQLDYFVQTQIPTDGSNQNQVQARRLHSMSEVALSKHDDVNKNELWYYLLWAAKPQL